MENFFHGGLPFLREDVHFQENFPKSFLRQFEYSVENIVRKLFAESPKLFLSLSKKNCQLTIYFLQKVLRM